MSSGKDLAPVRRELPAINTPVSVAPAPRRRGVLTRTLGLLGAVGLTAAIVAPTGAAFMEPQQAVAAESQFTQVMAEAQNITIEGGATFTPAARGSFTVYVTPKPTPTPTPQATSKGRSTSSGGGGGAPARYTGGGAPAEWMAAAGIAESDWSYVDYIVRKESSWNPNATNKKSGACGLVQVYPCGKLANAYDPVVNLRWADGYAKGRYGSWAGAYNFWTRNHWW